MNTSYNIFPSTIFALLSKNSKLTFLKDVFGWSPKNTTERTQEFLNRKFKELDNGGNFDVEVKLINRYS